ncbi:MAG: sodium/proline symporter, partial [Ketobacteraceae bacterium]|nr:sodium/proline symporter [Ketobacteraceae bacterium]
MTVTVITFIVVMTLMTLSGASSIIKKKKTPSDYLVASRGVKPWLSALSTVATNNSGFMFIGMIAYTYRLGIESIWMMVGWILGDFLAWKFVHPKVRHASDRHECNTIPALIAQPVDARSNKEKQAVMLVAGLITFVFLSIYAAGQLKAGSTALHTLFGWDMEVGVLIGTAIVILYSYAGGIRADIWTDAAQSFVMIVSMGLIMIAGFMEVGGPAALMDNLRQQDPSLVRVFPDELQFGVVPFVIGFVFAGFGVVGQPHLMTRLMAIESVKAIRRARLYYFMWFIPFFIASIGVGLYCRAILPDLASMPLASSLEEPTELALPVITMELLPDFFIGLSLAGLFAATVSTADSQIIVCSGAITQDVNPKWRESYLASKLATMTVTAMALFVALYAPEGVFALVLIAWSALGASLG